MAEVQSIDQATQKLQYLPMPILVLIFLLVSSNALAANWTKQADDQLKVELGVVSTSFAFEMKTPKELGQHTAKFQPHVGPKTALGLGYRNLGANISTTNATKPDDDLKYGTSSATDVQIRLYGKRTYEFSYQAYSGYYVENSQDLDPSYLNSEMKIQRPDITTRNASFNFFWNFHEEDYSLSVALAQNGVQKKSGWSSFALLSAYDSEIKGDSALIPTAAATTFGTLSNLQEVHRQLYVVGAGVGGIAALGGFYATGFIAAGVGYQNVLADYGSSGTQKLQGTGSYASLRAGLGYNGDRNSLGLQLIFDLPNTKLDDGDVTQNIVEGKLAYAYRFSDVNIPPLNWISSWLD